MAAEGARADGGTDQTPAPFDAVGPRMEGLIDCVIPAHSKDYETLGRAVDSVLAHCPEVRRVLVVSREPWLERPGVEWVDEASSMWPFRLEDLEGCGCPPGWLLQQLLKLHAPLLIPDLSESVLVCDADVVWLGMADGAGVHFLNPGSPGSPIVAWHCTFSEETCPPIRSQVDLSRYDSFVTAVLPGLAKQRPSRETAVCHHALFRRELLQELAARVEASSSLPFWATFRDAALACSGRASEYELYHAFACSAFPERVAQRQLTFAVVADLEAALEKPPEGAAFVVAHSHLRGLSEQELRDREGVINGDINKELLRRLVHIAPDAGNLVAASGLLG